MAHNRMCALAKVISKYACRSSGRIEKAAFGNQMNETRRQVKAAKQNGTKSYELKT